MNWKPCITEVAYEKYFSMKSFWGVKGMMKNLKENNFTTVKILRIASILNENDLKFQKAQNTIFNSAIVTLLNLSEK